MVILISDEIKKIEKVGLLCIFIIFFVINVVMI